MTYSSLCQHTSLKRTVRFVGPTDNRRLGLYIGRSLKALTEDELQSLADAYPHPSEIDIVALRKFRMKLELMEKLVPNPVIPYQEIWKGSLLNKAEFTKYLKDTWGALVAGYWCKGDHTLVTYNHLFPYRHLPEWEEEIDDIAYRSIPNSTDPAVLKRFKEFAKADLLKHLEGQEIPIPALEVARDRYYNSVSYNWEKKEKVPLSDHIQDCWKEPSEYRFVRCKVPVCPGNGRDTVIADWHSSVLLRWAELAYAQILPYYKESIIGVSPSMREARMKSFYKLRGRFFLRDFKKCGMTYSLDVLETVGELVSELLGEELFAKHSRLFRSQVIYDPESGEFIYPSRGYGLGMANHMATLCMILTYRFACHECSIPVGRSIFFNDDSCFYITKKQESSDFFQKYLHIEELLGNIINYEKCGVSIAPILLEEYGSGAWQDGKISLIACEIVDIMFLESDDYKAIRVPEVLNRIMGTRWEPYVPALFSYMGSTFEDTGFLDVPAYLGGANPSLESASGDFYQTIRGLEKYKMHYYLMRRKLVKSILDRRPYSSDAQKYGSSIPSWVRSTMSCSWEQEKKRLEWAKYSNTALSRLIKSRLRRWRPPPFNEDDFHEYLLSQGIITPEAVEEYASEVILVDPESSKGVRLPSALSEWRLCKYYGGYIPWINLPGIIGPEDVDSNKHEATYTLQKVFYPRYGYDIMQLPGYGIDACREFYEKYGAVPQSLRFPLKRNNMYYPEELCIHTEDTVNISPCVIVQLPTSWIDEDIPEIEEEEATPIDDALEELWNIIENEDILSLVEGEEEDIILDGEGFLPVIDEDKPHTQDLEDLWDEILES